MEGRVCAGERRARAEIPAEAFDDSHHSPGHGEWASQLLTLWRSAESRANPSLAQLPANSDVCREFCVFEGRVRALYWRRNAGHALEFFRSGACE